MPQEIKESVHSSPKKQEELLEAIHTANFETLRNIIEKKELSLQIPLETQQNDIRLLHFIVMSKKGEGLKLLEWVLINRPSEIDINVQTANGYTPLAVAADFRNIEAVKLLIAYGAKTEIKNVHGKTALEICKNRFSSSEVNSIKRAIEDRKKSNLSPSKPIFLTEQEAALTPLVKENQSANAAQNPVNTFKNKLYSTVAFWRHTSNKPTKEEVPLLDEDKKTK